MVNARFISRAAQKVFKTLDLPVLGQKFQGKVRDIYVCDGKRILVTSDRISAFDRVLGYIPYKGQVLNLLSQFWFEKTKDIVANHLIAVPHPNVSIVKNAKPYPVEMVVRGYLTGVTTTSIWYSYERGERMIYGYKFKNGMKKNQKLPRPIITPTTKAEHGAHDQRLTHDEILSKKLISPKILRQMEEVAVALYQRGNRICGKRGLILVDTKYEFADYKGKLMLIDEIHTPDSSRFWRGDNYNKRYHKGLEPVNFDKEFFRMWYTKQGYRGDGQPPKMSKELQIKTATRYIKIYEMITGKKFTAQEYPLEKGIQDAVRKYLHKN